MTYKDLNAFVNANVTAAINKAKKNLKKQKKEKKVELITFDKFCALNVDNNNEEDKPNVHAPTNVNNDDSFASCLLNDTDSDSNNKLMAGRDLAADNDKNNGNIDHVINY
eukprot:4141981-Ditylum_brightwellii.AAC.1